ncbi:fluoride efflux transporter FluC [Ornithinimicrobium sufpigmenti]|uniref:fluoride efflux transporter FluC n=1 Tax=Ornithinimicrobium sufpigmenti TaxID=2508882 RepID=UPI0015E1701A|nr:MULTISPECIES: CrcB family protein [unclassified Ornithinimicrobium]
MTDPSVTWGWAVLAVAVGGAVGALLRHLFTTASWGPLRGLLVVNTVGSAGLGAVVALVESPVMVLLLGTGLCGALTTWSTLAVQTAQLGRHTPGVAAAYLLLTLILGLTAALLTLAVLA